MNAANHGMGEVRPAACQHGRLDAEEAKNAVQHGKTQAKQDVRVRDLGHGGRDDGCFIVSVSLRRG